ncbi:MAG: serine/threonine-protein kinase [Planctomycetota bacterium]
MSGDGEERMGQLCDELQVALDAGQSVDVGGLAERFGLAESEVQKALQALAAFQQVLGGEEAAAVRELAPPQLSEDYEVQGELGRGGMGVVYRAHQKSLDRELAVKVLRPGELMFGDAIRRFELEAKSLARLRHRHIVSVHEVGKADGLVYFTMDLIEGCTLAELLKNGAMPTTQAVKLLLQISSAMAYAHGKGVMHRDLKPGNVLLDGHGDAFVCDFGLARELGCDVGATLTGQMLGTPAYMSPEQALGDRDKIGEQTDVYALGVILYECLAGAAPFAGLPLAQLMHAVIEKEPMPLRKRNSRVPVDLQLICEKAMAKEPQQRYATVQALAEDLERFSIGKEILARSPSTFAQGWRSLRRNRTALLRTLVPVAVLLAMAWLFVLPLILRSRTTALAERMREAGSVQGEVAAYEELYAGFAPSDIPEWDRARYLRACNDEAARLWVHGSDAEQDRADALCAEAKRLVGDPARHRYWSDLAARDRGLVEAFRTEWLRMNSWIHESPALSSFQFDYRETRDRMMAARRKSGREADMMFAVASITEIGLSEAPWTERQREAVLYLLPASERLPAGLRGHLRSLCRQHVSTPYEYVDFAFLERLVEIAADTSLHIESRCNAAALFDGCDWLPFLTETHTHSPHGGNERLVADSDLSWLTATWSRLQGLSRIEQYRGRTDAVIERYRDAQRVGTLSPIPERWTKAWLREHAGLGSSKPSHLRALQMQNRSSDPRDLLLAAMGWHMEADALTVDMLIERLGQSSDAQVHHLLELTVGSDIAVPQRSMWTASKTQARWLRALNRPEQHRRLLRVATFVVQDGDIEPRLFKSHQQLLAVNEQAEWRHPIFEELPFSAAHVGQRLPRDFTALHSPMALAGTARLQLNGSSVELNATAQMDGRMPFGVWPVTYDGDHDADDGIVAFLGGAYWTQQNQSARYTWFALATTRPASESGDAWSLEQWRDAIAATIEDISAENHLAINNAKHVAAASFLPTPVAPEIWQRLAKRYEEYTRQFPDFGVYCVKHRCAARLLAGDESAMEIDSGPSDGHGREFLDAAFYARLAATTKSDLLRDHAWSQLEGFRRKTDVLRAIAKHRDRVEAIPEAIAEQLAGLPSPTFTQLRDMCLPVGMLVVHLLLLAWAMSRMFGRYVISRDAGLAAVVLGLLFTLWGVYIGDCDCNPLWLGHVFATFSVWAVCCNSTRGFGWLFVALVWTGTTVAYLTNTLGFPDWMWGIAALALLLLPSQRHYIRPRRRTARAGAGTRA